MKSQRKNTPHQKSAATKKELDSNKPLLAGFNLQEHHQQLIRLRPAVEALEGIRANADTKPDINTPAWEKQRIGKNIKRLMIDCGWNAEQLAGEVTKVRKSGNQLDPKLVREHIKGMRRPSAATLADYAKVFSLKLEMPIKPSALLE